MSAKKTQFSLLNPKGETHVPKESDVAPLEKIQAEENQKNPYFSSLLEEKTTKKEMEKSISSSTTDTSSLPTPLQLFSSTSKKGKENKDLFPSPLQDLLKKNSSLMPLLKENIPRRGKETLSSSSQKKDDKNTGFSPIQKTQTQEDSRNTESPPIQRMQIPENRLPSKNKETTLRQKEDSTNTELAFIHQTQDQKNNPALNVQSQNAVQYIKETIVLIEQLTDLLTYSMQNGEQRSVLELNQPPLLRGSQIEIFISDHASKEVNITFQKVPSPEAERFVREQSNEMIQFLKDREIIVQQLVITQQEEPLSESPFHSSSENSNYSRGNKHEQGEGKREEQKKEGEDEEE